MVWFSAAGTGSSVSALLLLAVGAVTGLVAALLMDWPMSRQPDGFVPASIATAIVTRQSVDAVRLPETMVLHHLAGVLTGLIYAVLVVVIGAVVPPVVPAVGLNLLAHLFGVLVVVGFIYTFFAHFVLPRAGGQTYEERATAVRGQWLRSALVFGATMLVGVPLLVGALPR